MTLDIKILVCNLNIGQILVTAVEIINIILHKNATVNRIILQRIKTKQIYVWEAIIALITVNAKIIMIQDI